MLNLSPTKAKIAASFWQATTAAELTQWRAQGLDIAELRLDLAADDSVEHWRAIAKSFADIPTILTVRWQKEGGKFAGDETARYERIKTLLPLVDAVDIELDSPICAQVATTVRAHGGRTLIISHHNFVSAIDADTLDSLSKRAWAAGADAVKFACLCTSEADLQTLIVWTQQQAQQNRTVITIGMDDGSSNPHAHRARSALPRAGAALAFAAAVKASAPGQLPLAAMTAALTNSA